MAVTSATDYAERPTPPSSSDSGRDAVEPILALRGVTKRFGGATALDNVDFELLPGEIHGLVGENGAGKSTLMKILSGVHAPDEGEIVLRGEVVTFSTPAESKARGIGMIYQELSCMPALTVAENVFLGSQPTTRSGLIDWKKMRRDAGEHLGALGIDIDVASPLGRFRSADSNSSRSLGSSSPGHPSSSSMNRPRRCQVPRQSGSLPRWTS